MSKCRKIPASEWERHKQTITRLYSEKPLTDVIAEMEMEHGFKARWAKFLSVEFSILTILVL